jgi:NADH-quinone oxidoreductase subunit A
VEVAFFFPWATVFGKANTLAQEGITAEKRLEITNELTPPYLPATEGDNRGKVLPPAPIKPETAKTFAWLAMLDMAIFFGVLLVGFAYLWRRGDINWVRSTVAERLAAQPRAAPMGVTSEEELVGAGQRSSV